MFVRALNEYCKNHSGVYRTVQRVMSTGMPQTRVVVVGGGASGLAAASKIVEERPDTHVAILEASSYIGGRVCVDSQWSDTTPVDMGGEFIHGEDSIVTRLADKHGWHMHEVSRNVLQQRQWDFVHIDGELVPLWDTSHPAMAEALAAWEKIQDLGWHANQTAKHRLRTQRKQHAVAESPGAESLEDVDADSGPETEYQETVDCSIGDVCARMGVGTSAMAIMKCVIAQTDGGCWNNFGLADFCEEWPYGETDSRFDQSYGVLLKHYLRTLQRHDTTIQVSSPVIAVEAVSSDSGNATGCNGMVVHCRAANTDEDRTSIHCDYVVVTTPLTVLQKRQIAFTPELPGQVQDAIDALPMYSCIKVCMRFNQQFWPQGSRLWYCASGVLSQYWADVRAHREHINPQPTTSSNPIEQGNAFLHLVDGSSKNGFVKEVKRSDLFNTTSATTSDAVAAESPAEDTVHLVFGFATADVAKDASELSDEDLVQRSLKQLDDIFRNCSQGQETSASDCFESALVCNWSKHPYVMGGYSAPVVGGADIRPRLAAPLYDGRMFLAGEGTHRQPSSVQAAIETGTRAALGILSQIQ